MRSPNRIIKIFLCAVSALCRCFTTNAQVTGSIDTLRIKHTSTGTERMVFVWKPTNYDTNIQYKVLLMHDGQMLFDGKSTWNKKEWRADEISDSLIKHGVLDPFIIVGVCNAEKLRYQEYFPQDCLAKVPARIKEELELKNLQTIGANAYLNFLCNELLPQIRKRYNTISSAQSVALAGASMGGLISWYGLAKRPDIFGHAICMSTHWPGSKPEKYGDTLFRAFHHYIKHAKKLKNSLAKKHTLYFDCGDQTLDQYYPPYQHKIDELFFSFQPQPHKYKAIYVTNAPHDEVAWSTRLADALVFVWGR